MRPAGVRGILEPIFLFRKSSVVDSLTSTSERAEMPTLNPSDRLCIEKTEHHGFTLIRIISHVTSLKNLKELYELLDDDIHQGRTKLAVAFSSRSIITSSIVSVFLNWMKKLKPCGGRLAIILSNPDTIEVMKNLGTHRILDFYESETAFLASIES
jgi:anti-anti-sigma regulatory factor